MVKEPSPLKKERRKAPRFKAKPSAFASLHTGHIRLGQVIDICRCGLAFSYIEDMAWDEMPAAGPASLDLLCEGTHLQLQRHQFRVVADTRMDATHPFSSLPMRRVSMELQDLSEEEELRLFHCRHRS